MPDADSHVRSTDREIEISRVFNAPRELVWKAFTDPAQIPQWWGPRGFTTRTERMDVKPGGQWRFVMIGPDGQEYRNLITYLEVVEPERLCYKHGGDMDVEPVNFQVTVTLERVGQTGDRTLLTMRSIFPSTNAKEFVVREYNAIEGGRQTLARLGEHLDSGRNAASSSDGPSVRPFVLSRVFQAPRTLVWDVWTQPQHLSKWMSPKGSAVMSARMDLRVGGIYHYGLKGPDGNEMWGKWVFREIVVPERLVFVQTCADAAGAVTRHPYAPSWPLETLSTITFAEHAGRGRGTTVALTWTPINATDAERNTFDTSHAGMQQGWGGTMEQLTAYLAGLA